jgi:hypothetical protein
VQPPMRRGKRRRRGRLPSCSIVFFLFSIVFFQRKCWGGGEGTVFLGRTVMGRFTQK